MENYPSSNYDHPPSDNPKSDIIEPAWIGGDSQSATCKQIVDKLLLEERCFLANMQVRKEAGDGGLVWCYSEASHNSRYALSILARLMPLERMEDPSLLSSFCSNLLFFVL